MNEKQPVNEERERPGFEAWVTQTGHSLCRIVGPDGGLYSNDRVRDTWEAWLASAAVKRPTLMTVPEFPLIENPSGEPTHPSPGESA